LRTTVLFLIVLAAVACGRMPGSKKVKYTATDEATVNAVVEEVLARLGTEYEEHGPEFVERVPQVKQEVAVAKGFTDWREFTERVRLLSPEKDLWVANRITARLDELIGTPAPREPEDDEE
jgi:uncharacterized protein YheU (UPF0270 family)